MSTNSVLLVDDEALIRRSLENQIGQAGYEISTAASGEEALRQFDASHFDLLVLDLALPDIGGLEILKKVKAIRPSTAVIIITGYGDMSTAINALRLGADDYLLKPFSREELLYRIDQGLQKQQNAGRLRMYKEIIGASNDLVSLIAADYTFLIVNEAWAGFLGKKPDDLPGLKVYDLLDRDLFEQKMQHHLDQCFQGKICRHQDYLRGADNSKRFFHFSYAPYHAGSDEVCAAVVIIRDLTDYHRIAEELGQSENRLRLALDASSDGVWDYNLASGQKYYGDNWAGLLGYTSTEVASRQFDLEELLHPEDREQALSAIEAHLRGTTDRYCSEFRLRTRKGDWQWILARGQVVDRDEDGRPLRFIGTHTDITARKEAELALLTLNTELENEVARRTSQLARQKEDLEQVNAALTVLLKKRELDREELEDQMLTNLRMLVAPYIGKLQRSTLDPRQQAWLDILAANLDNVVSPFARRLSSGHLPLTPSEIQIANFIKEGKTSKEIAGIMNLSPETISNHRKHIRKKTGITNRKVNLRTALTSLSHS